MYRQSQKERIVVIVPPQKTMFTADDLLTLPNGKMSELVDGRVVEKPMGGESSFIGGRVLMLLAVFCDEHQLGWVFPSDAGYQCFSDEPDRVRKPDVSFVDRLRLPKGKLPEGHIKIAPDLAVEVVSPNDLYEEISAKVVEYLRAGVKLVWVVDPQSRRVNVYRASGGDSILSQDDELSGEDVVPGFRVPLTKVFQTSYGSET